MIPGYATPEATANRAGQFDFSYRPFGNTGLMVSPAGFGCYRITTGVPSHTLALKQALLSGINLIDTSTNYGDGESEKLVGQVLDTLFHDHRLKREEIVVVSKVGYLQGQNLALSQERINMGKPFPDLVVLSDGLEHCIHPEFIDQQIGASLDRLGLETLDVCLLHNPEYYLDWAHQQGMDIQSARDTYYQRIQLAFDHLENEVNRGRIRHYGISSNNFPNPIDDPGFTSLSAVLNLAKTGHENNHFQVIQFPFNLLESGAAITVNQDHNQTLLELAHGRSLAVMINRPLNAIVGAELIRLSDIHEPERPKDNTVIAAIKAVKESEGRFWRKLLPKLSLASGLQVRIKEQLCVGETLTHHWRNFSSYQRWRQIRDGNFWPRIHGVMNYLTPHAETDPALATWKAHHLERLESAFRSIGGVYAESARLYLTKLRRAMAEADPDWSGEGSMSQIAIRALISTAGVSSVLVGMRQPDYVTDVLEALTREYHVAPRRESWDRLHPVS